ncbi:ROK family protein [Micrococcaceae bacterium Sec5.7]
MTEATGTTPGGRGAGRPARLYRFNAAAGYVVGIDVGIHSVRALLANMAGDIIARVEETVVPGTVGQDRMKSVKRVIGQCLSKARVPKGDLLALGVAVSGLVGANGRLVVSRNFPDWEGADIAGHLRAEFQCIVVVDNDIRLAAFAEHKLGAAQLVDDVAYFFVGHRMSVGLIIGGKIRHGRHNAAGEIGDIAFSGWANEAGELAWTSAATGEQVFKQASEGDSASQAEIARFVEAIAPGVATVVMAVDPDVVVIGGGLSRAGELLLQPLRKAVQNQIVVPVVPTIIGSDLGAESVVLGAAAQAFEQISAVLFGVEDIPAPALNHRSLPPWQTVDAARKPVMTAIAATESPRNDSSPRGVAPVS